MNNSQPFIIIIQGAPAVGKTTLAKKLAKDLGIGVLAKDDLKEFLSDNVGKPRDKSESFMYGDAAMKALYIIVETFVRFGKSFIFESAFWRDLANDEFHDIQRKHNIHLVQIFCHCDEQTQIKRFNNRVDKGDRHAVHMATPREAIDFAKLKDRYRALDIPQTINVDTTHLSDTDYSVLVEKIKKLNPGGEV